MGAADMVTIECDFCPQVFQVSQTYIFHMKINHPGKPLKGIVFK